MAPREVSPQVVEGLEQKGPLEGLLDRASQQERSSQCSPGPPNALQVPPTLCRSPQRPAASTAQNTAL